MLSESKRKELEQKLLIHLLDSPDEIAFFRKNFTFIAPLGEGAFGLVFSARWNTQSNMVVAVKALAKDEFERHHIEQFRKEASIAKQLEHECLIVENERRMYIITEIMRGGTLDQMMQRRFDAEADFTEDEVRIVIKRLIFAVNYIQNQNTVHRDIKPENVLLEKPNDLSTIKLADFGLSIKAAFEKTMALNVKCGTPAYMAPEMFIDNTYTKVVDMWSIGVIFYRLLTKGKLPFGKEELKRLARNTELSVDEKFSELVCSKNCMHLLRKLLEPNDLRRIPAYQAYKHPYLTGEDNREPALMMFEIEEAFSVRCNLKKVFNFLLILKKIKDTPGCQKTNAPKVRDINVMVHTPTDSKRTNGSKEYRISHQSGRLNPFDDNQRYKTSKFQVASERISHKDSGSEGMRTPKPAQRGGVYSKAFGSAKDKTNSQTKLISVNVIPRPRVISNTSIDKLEKNVARPEGSNWSKENSMVPRVSPYSHDKELTQGMRKSSSWAKQFGSTQESSFKAARLERLPRLPPQPPAASEPSKFRVQPKKK